MRAHQCHQGPWLHGLCPCWHHQLFPSSRTPSLDFSVASHWHSFSYDFQCSIWSFPSTGFPLHPTPSSHTFFTSTTFKYLYFLPCQDHQKLHSPESHLLTQQRPPNPSDSLCVERPPSRVPVPTWQIQLPTLSSAAWIFPCCRSPRQPEASHTLSCPVYYGPALLDGSWALKGQEMHFSHHSILCSSTVLGTFKSQKYFRKKEGQV